MDVDTGGVSGTPQQPGVFHVQVRAASGELSAAAGGFALSVRACTATSCKNGGRCRTEDMYSRTFACDCAGTGHSGAICTTRVDTQAAFSVSWGTNVSLPVAALRQDWRFPAPDAADVNVVGALDHYIATGLPCGLSLDQETGALAGFPGESGVYDVQIMAVSSTGQSLSVTANPFTLTVADCDDALTCNGGGCTPPLLPCPLPFLSFSARLTGLALQSLLRLARYRAVLQCLQLHPRPHTVLALSPAYAASMIFARHVCVGCLYVWW